MRLTLQFALAFVILAYTLPMSSVASGTSGDQVKPIADAQQRWETMQQWLDDTLLSGMQASFEGRFALFALAQVDDDGDTFKVTLNELSETDRPVSRIQLNLVIHERDRLIELIPINISASYLHEEFSSHKWYISRRGRAGAVNLDEKVALFTSKWEEPEARRPHLRILPDEALRMLHRDREYWQRSAMPGDQEHFDDFKTEPPRWGRRGEYVERVDRVTSTRFKTDKDGDWVYYDRIVLFSEEADWMPVRAWVEIPQLNGRPSPEARFEWQKASGSDSSGSQLRIGSYTLIAIHGLNPNVYDKSSKLRYTDEITYWPKSVKAIPANRADELISIDTDKMDGFETVMFRAKNEAVEIDPAVWETITDDELKARLTPLEEKFASRRSNSATSKWWLGSTVVLIAGIVAFVLYRWKIA